MLWSQSNKTILPDTKKMGTFEIQKSFKKILKADLKQERSGWI